MTPDLNDFDAVLLDIEGTTTPISFVYDTLFPYAAAALERFLERRWGDEDVERDVAAITAQAREDIAQGHDAPAIPAPGEVDEETRRDRVLDNLRWQMERDRKTTGLKSLQGKIWRDGYLSGELAGELFEDVPDALRAIHASGRPIRIYSSGSVEAQRLLFGHSTHGDLTPLLDGYHDTTTGPKKQAQSYRAIAQAMALEPGRILFATDNLDEAKAAREAGAQAVIMNRPGNHALPEHDFATLEDFTPIVAAL